MTMRTQTHAVQASIMPQAARIQLTGPVNWSRE